MWRTGPFLYLRARWPSSRRLGRSGHWRRQSTVGGSRGVGGGVEATTGFEPVNRGFADLRVEPLHHVARGLAAPRGFEPRFTDPKSAVLPLDEGAAGGRRPGAARGISRARKWSGRRDSNPRPSPWQGDALPTEPLPLDDATTRSRWCREPESNWRHRDFQSRALPTELSRPDGQPGFGRPSAEAG